MHNLTDNNKFSVEPRDNGWVARITFFEAPVTEKRGRTRFLTPTGRHEYFMTSMGGYEQVTISVRADSPDTALAKLWAVCDETAAWSWNALDWEMA